MSNHLGAYKSEVNIYFENGKQHILTVITKTEVNHSKHNHGSSHNIIFHMWLKT